MRDNERYRREAVPQTQPGTSALINFWLNTGRMQYNSVPAEPVTGTGAPSPPAAAGGGAGSKMAVIKQKVVDETKVVGKKLGTEVKLLSNEIAEETNLPPWAVMGIGVITSLVVLCILFCICKKCLW